MPLPRTRLLATPLPAPGETARLSREEASHARARRLRPGDPVVLFDGSGAEARGVLAALDRSGAEVLVESLVAARVAEAGISLFAAGLRAERLAWLAEKATELDADQLTIVTSERTQSFRASPNLHERLERVSREAAKQCGAARWPRISGPISFETALVQDPAFHRLLLDAEGERFPASLASRPVVLLVGPEGGWTPSERGAARDRGWLVVALPAGKLRAETAAVAALVLARAALAAGNPSQH